MDRVNEYQYSSLFTVECGLHVRVFNLDSDNINNWHTILGGVMLVSGVDITILSVMNAGNGLCLSYAFHMQGHEYQTQPTNAYQQTEFI